jgi:hypothetical protein
VDGQERSNDLMNAMALLSKYQWNDIIAFDVIGEIVKHCGVSWTDARKSGMALGVVSRDASVAAVHGYTRRQLIDKFKRAYPTGEISVPGGDDDAETEQLVVPWAEVAAAVAFVMLGKDPGLGGLSAHACIKRKEAFKQAFWDEIKRRNP